MDAPPPAGVGERRLRFNVGGQLFETTWATLAKHESSMLAAWGSNPALWADSDELFVDRSPKYFELILDWMRTDLVPALPPHIGVRNLIEEARFYLLDRLVHDLEHARYRPTRYELHQLMQTKDLSYTDLSGMVLRERNLSGFRLDGANLAGADLTGADLTLATLTDADLSDACLEDAVLRGTVLTRAVCVRTNFRRAQLSYATVMDHANVDGADWRDVKGLTSS